MNILQKALTQLFVGANLGCILLLWGCCLSTWMSPVSHPILSTIGLAFPVFLFLNALFVLFWLIFKIKYIWIPLVGIACAASFIQDYCPFHTNSGEAPEGAVKVLSFNTFGVHSQGQKDSLLTLLREENADIVCLQEMPGSWTNQKETKQLIEDLGYHATQKGQFVTLTHFPILQESFEKDLFECDGRSVACLVDFEGEILIIINNHLASYQITPDERAEYKDMMKDPKKEKVKSSGHMLLDRISTANVIRATQTDSLYLALGHHENTRIVMCGDFNDTPISYTYQKLLKRLKNTFRESGIGVGRSFNEKGFFVRIDHIFVSHDWTSHKTCILSQIKLSDHYPIVTYLTKKVK